MPNFAATIDASDKPRDHLSNTIGHTGGNNYLEDGALPNKFDDPDASGIDGIEERRA